MSDDDDIMPLVIVLAMVPVGIFLRVAAVQWMWSALVPHAAPLDFWTAWAGMIAIALAAGFRPANSDGKSPGRLAGEAVGRAVLHPAIACCLVWLLLQWGAQ